MSYSYSRDRATKTSQGIVLVFFAGFASGATFAAALTLYEMREAVRTGLVSVEDITYTIEPLAPQLEARE